MIVLDPAPLNDPPFYINVWKWRNRPAVPGVVKFKTRDAAIRSQERASVLYPDKDVRVVYRLIVRLK